MVYIVSVTFYGPRKYYCFNLKTADRLSKSFDSETFIYSISVIHFLI